MRKYDLKSVFLGFVIAFVGLTAVYTVNATSSIRSASYSQTKVYWLGQEIPLENPLVSVVAEGETNARLYMPLRELLEFMNFIVEFDGQNNKVNLSMRGLTGNVSADSSAYSNNNQTQPYAWDSTGIYSGGYSEDPATLSQAEADRRAVDIMQRTGNWSFIEPYLPHMSNEGITRMVDIFNSKRPNHPHQHRNARDYFN